MSDRFAWFRDLRALRDGALEYVTMKHASREADALADDRRETLRHTLKTASQKRDAAELLLARDARAEAVGLAMECAALLSSVLEGAGAARALETSRVRRARGDLELARATLVPAPAVDADVTARHTQALRRLLRAELALEQPVHEALLDRRGVTRLRWQRWITIALVLIAPFGGVAFVRASFLGLSARGSSVLDEQYTADRVLDGDPDTEWVPNGKDEWLDIRFRPRVVRAVRILNGDTLPDRAAQEIRVDFYLNSDLLLSSKQTFDERFPAEWVTVPAGYVMYNRIRIVVTSHYGLGAAIAEVELK